MTAAAAGDGLLKMGSGGVLPVLNEEIPAWRVAFDLTRGSQG